MKCLCKLISKLCRAINSASIEPINNEAGYLNVLKIFLYGNPEDIIVYNVKWPNREHKGFLRPWKDFYKWFFCKENSPYFTIKCNKGQRLIRRKDIKSFEVCICKEEIEEA